jgi:hypothetical protein
VHTSWMLDIDPPLYVAIMRLFFQQGTPTSGTT